jgi:poly(ADP-ribose) glycohydrolase ARH3
MKRFLQYSEDKVAGLLFGTFLGDAIGAPFEGVSCDEIPPLDSQYISNHPPKTYTDDTQMSLSVFEEMYENGCIETNSLMQRFLKRFTHWRRYGGGMLEVIERWRDGEDPGKAASSLYNGAGSFGDGAAMRAAPVSAFFKLDEVGELSEQVRKCSFLTHTHPYGIAGAILQAHVVLLALNNIPPEKWLGMLFSSDIESAFKITLEKVVRCLERQATASESAREIGNGADALEAVPAAIYSVMRNKGAFSDAVLFAVSMGGDTDTIGAMAGALAGSCFGMRKMPVEWMMYLENEREGKDFIAELVKKALKAKV